MTLDAILPIGARALEEPERLAAAAPDYSLGTEVSKPSTAVRDGEALRMTRWHEIEEAALADPPVELVKGLLVASDTLLMHGYTGAKKSIAAIEMALAIERETPFLGHFATRRAHVGIIDLESEQRRLGGRLPLLRRGHGITDDDDRLPLFKVAQGIRIDTDEGIAWLFRLIEANELDVVMFDTLIRVHRLDENVAGEVAQLFDRLRGLKQRVRNELGRDLTIVLLHHAPKPRTLGSNSAETMARGSGDLLGQVEAGLYLRNGKDGQVIFELSKFRWGEELPKFAATVDGGEDHLRLVYAGAATEAESKAEAAQRFMVEALMPDLALFRQELIDRATANKIGKRTAEDALKALRKAGQIDSEQVGQKARYRLTEAGVVA